MIVRDAPQEHFGWLLERLGYSPTLEFRALEALDSNGAIGAMVGFDWWTPNSVQMHVAILVPACGRAILRPAFEAVFVRAKKGLALGTIPADRRRCLNLATRLGFEPLSLVHDGWSRGVDLHLFQMRRENCRWLDATQRKVA